DTPFECPSDWSTHRQYCYKFFQQKESWDDRSEYDAERFCSEQAKGGHLVSIESDEEADFVAQLVAPNIGKSKYYVWIGLRIENKKQQCSSKWSDYSSVSYENLVRGNVKKCFALEKKQGFRKWVNIDCVEGNPFVCKFIRPR
uniref:Snaclec GPIB-binding protein subunit alpha n=1 Tax=Bothrops jararaca TaxID=8724 RepID=SL1A_BOTJA|nr:RecName: Full=Snaclec GPIB-binding protein subunit alpha; Short=GPIb-BP subunit alpha [Bothrops jararaca]AAB47092.1 platelet glycoprotein Ib-binding protein alpha subunit, GPIb-BP alpha subunit [Bothrops jararaca, venom, Peptide, 142 aa] [Bothrops jararaca]